MARHRWQAARAVTAVAAVMVTLACGSADDPRPSSSSSPPALPASGTGTVQIGGRQVTVHVPASYDPARPGPRPWWSGCTGTRPTRLSWRCTCS
ncbi:hypothetical protein ACPCHT_10010 [Nucisporomicrobium flavum]|uniref:hypothetical protein n=1 Tax=Nucisporomicrobium flavum TaxID=2785915 RepID=UPI003C2E57E4